VIDHDTFKLFKCEDGLPTFAYSYEEALEHTPPYLCDFAVMKLKTKFQDDGISKRTVSLEDQKRLILEAIVENYGDYRDYNSTTTQSDQGNRNCQKKKA
jgi:type I site-specific restriction endonuclease